MKLYCHGCDKQIEISLLYSDGSGPRMVSIQRGFALLVECPHCHWLYGLRAEVELLERQTTAP